MSEAQSEYSKLMEELESLKTLSQACRNNAIGLRERADTEDEKANVIDAKIEMADKFSSLIRSMVDEAKNANDNLQSSFRRYTSAARETSADEAKFDEFSRSFADGVGVVYEVPADQEEEVNPVAIAS